MAVDDLRTRIAKVLYMWYAEDIPYQTETCGDDWESEGESYKDAWRQQADAVIRELGSRLHPGAQEPHRRQMDTSRGVDGLPGVRRMTEPLDAECPICGAGPGQDCRNTIQPGKPLPGRMSHFARAINAWMAVAAPYCQRCGIPHKPPCKRPEDK